MKPFRRRKRVKGDVLLVRVTPEGRIHVQGDEARIEELLKLCRARGLIIRLDKKSPCG